MICVTEQSWLWLLGTYKWKVLWIIHCCSEGSCLGKSLWGINSCLIERILYTWILRRNRLIRRLRLSELVRSMRVLASNWWILVSWHMKRSIARLWLLLGRHSKGLRTRRIGWILIGLITNSITWWCSLNSWYKILLTSERWLTLHRTRVLLSVRRLSSWYLVLCRWHLLKLRILSTWISWLSHILVLLILRLKRYSLVWNYIWLALWIDTWASISLRLPIISTSMTIWALSSFIAAISCARIACTSILILISCTIELSVVISRDTYLSLRWNLASLNISSWQLLLCHIRHFIFQWWYLRWIWRLYCWVTADFFLSTTTVLHCRVK